MDKFEKIVFDHSKETKSECIGISDDRLDAISKSVSKSLTALFITDDSLTDIMKGFEFLLNDLNPQSAAELALASMAFQSGYEKFIRIEKKLEWQDK